MIAAHLPVQRPVDAKLLVVEAVGAMRHWPRARFVELLRSDDLVVANDAATLPASLQGVHVPSACPIEVRLAGHRSLASDDVNHFSAIVFGAGDFHVRTENRALPPLLRVGDRMELGPLSATIEAILEPPRLVKIT